MTTDKDVLYAKVPMPCGIPLMQVVIKGRDGQEGEYTISSDGKGDRAQIQTIERPE